MSLPNWYLALYSVGTGLSMLGFWTWVVASGRTRGMGEGRDDFGWHVASEMTTGALLLASGVALFADPDARASVVLSAIGLGAIVYALVESAGHYVARANRQMIAAVGLGWVFTIPALILRFVA